ncbi:hypothetical protein K0M31_007760, partial [Melipona bicolor]
KSSRNDEKNTNGPGQTSYAEIALDRRLILSFAERPILPSVHPSDQTSNNLDKPRLRSERKNKESEKTSVGTTRFDNLLRETVSPAASRRWKSDERSGPRGRFAREQDTLEYFFGRGTEDLQPREQPS